MTKEITKAFILQQIQDKFRLRDLEPEKFAFSECVIPVYEIGEHLALTAVKEATVSITSSAAFVFFQVPPTERWHLHRYNVIFMTGSFKVAGLMVTRNEVTEYVYLDLTKNQTVSYAVDLPKPVILDSGSCLRVYVDDYTTTGDLMLRIDATVEEIR